MLTHITAAKCVGIDAVPITVEVDITHGIGIHLCGLADVAVKESLLRTTTALQALGYHLPGKRIVINLAPADLHKSGSGFDLPILLGILAASEQESLPSMEDFLIMGELGLDASVRDIPGALPFGELAARLGLKGCILPSGSAAEAAQMDGIDVYGVESVADVIKVLNGNGGELLAAADSCTAASPQGEYETVDFADIIGQDNAKRGLEIAAAGGHNLILVGSPGSGKSSLAKALTGILPPMSKEEAFVSGKIFSIAGKSAYECFALRRRPFRAPHYSASLPAIIGGGGGDGVIPGECSLATNGVLFLDEFAQMARSTVEALRGPMEDRYVTISRLRAKVKYPASFMLVAASNPCPCGYWGEGNRCTCTVGQRLNYLGRLQGPLMDRIDIQIWMHPVSAGEVFGAEKGRPSSDVAAKVAAAREIQRRRFGGSGISTNAEMTSKMIERYCPLSEECSLTMQKIMSGMALSMRAYFRIIKVARTIADLSGSEDIRPEHLFEAAGYRALDRERD